MKRFLTIIFCLLFCSPCAFAFQPNKACGYLQGINGLSTSGYKSDGMGGYFCSSPYKMLDGKSNLAYYVEGVNTYKANKIYLVLNVYNSSSKKKVHASLLTASKVLAKKSINITLNKQLANNILSGKSSKFKQVKYIVEIKKQNWPTKLGYEIHFSITEL